jgi:hypothetical protein
LPRQPYSLCDIGGVHPGGQALQLFNLLTGAAGLPARDFLRWSVALKNVAFGYTLARHPQDAVSEVFFGSESWKKHSCSFNFKAIRDKWRL